jgi:hypothetical protein
MSSSGIPPFFFTAFMQRQALHGLRQRVLSMVHGEAVGSIQARK